MIDIVSLNINKQFFKSAVTTVYTRISNKRNKQLSGLTGLLLFKYKNVMFNKEYVSIVTKRDEVYISSKSFVFRHPKEERWVYTDKQNSLLDCNKNLSTGEIELYKDITTNSITNWSISFTATKDVEVICCSISIDESNFTEFSPEERFTSLKHFNSDEVWTRIENSNLFKEIIENAR